MLLLWEERTHQSQVPKPELTQGRVGHQSDSQTAGSATSTASTCANSGCPMLWTKLFPEAQGHPMAKNVLFQDNRSAMLLEENGCKSAGKRSRHLNFGFFFATNWKAKGNIDIEHCPTDQMKGDCMTKPLHGEKFTRFRQDIMNLPMTEQLMIVVVCIA